MLLLLEGKLHARDPAILARMFFTDVTQWSGFFHNRSSKKYADTGFPPHGFPPHLFFFPPTCGRLHFCPKYLKICEQAILVLTAKPGYASCSLGAD